MEATNTSFAVDMDTALHFKECTCTHSSILADFENVQVAMLYYFMCMQVSFVKHVLQPSVVFANLFLYTFQKLNLTIFMVLLITSELSTHLYKDHLFIRQTVLLKWCPL